MDDLLSLKCISRVTRCLYILALLAAKDFAYYGPKLVCKTNVKEKKTSVPGKMRSSISVLFKNHYSANFTESDRANLANVNISNIFWNLMENAERRKVSQTGNKRKPSLVEF